LNGYGGKDFFGLFEYWLEHASECGTFEELDLDKTALVKVIAVKQARDAVKLCFRRKFKSCCCLVYPRRRSSGLKSVHHLMRSVELKD